MVHDDGEIPAGGGNGLKYRGVAYDTGSNHETGQGHLSRMLWSSELMRAEIDSIADDLRANSVTIYGTLVERLTETVAYALERGLHVWLQPRLMDGEQADVLDYLGETARLAESFRAQGGDIHFSIGCTHSIQTAGIMPGDSYHSRMGNVFAHANHRFLRPVGPIDHADVKAKLNAFLTKAAAVARANFRGGLTYSGGPFEDVDWSLVDYIGLVEYYYYRTPQEWVAYLDTYRKWNKPVLISEYGTFTYAGAETKGLLGFDVVDRSQEPPKVIEGFVRDEGAQADFHLRMLRLFDTWGIHGVAVTEFVHPTHPHSDDPLWDLDTASMTITKSIRENYFDHLSPYTFEPKESFLALARYYQAVADRERRQAAA